MTEMFRNNIDVLMKFNSAAAIAVQNCICAGIEPVKTKNGDAVPQVDIGGKKILLHSRFDPVIEAERFTAEITAENYTLFAVAGFGYGYHLEALLKKASADATFLVLEKSPAIVRSAMENRDLSALLGDPRLLLLIGAGEDDIAQAMRGRSSRTTAFIAHRGSCQADPDYYPNILRIAKSYISAKDVNVATLAKFEKTWSSNIIRNVPTLCSSADAGSFFGAFAGIPAIVVAAGPSLTESIPFIRQNMDRAVIIAVDTSYFILRRYGIQPHFCVSVDPQVINARYFEGETSGTTVLVGDPCAHPSIYRLFKGRVCLTGIPFDMMKWIERATGEKGELAHGGSVSTNAYDFAKRLGCSPVILTGQDLAFTSKLAHARGSYLDEQIHLRTNRVMNAQMFNRFQLTALPAIWRRGIRSEKVHTNQKMMIFLAWFEKRNDPECINATFNGCYLHGIQHVPTEEIHLSPRSDIAQKIDAAFAAAVPSAEEAEQKRRQVKAMVGNMIVSSRDLVEKLERAVVLSDDLCRIFEKGGSDSGKVSYILKKLEDVDRSLEALGDAKDMVGLSVQRVIHTITEGYEVDEGAVSKDHAVAMKSRYLYKGLLDGSSFTLKALERIEMVLG